MLELAVKGNKWYWGWMVVLLGIIGAGFGLYLMQLKFGLGITGMSRDVSWGFYIANFTYLVGVAAGGRRTGAAAVGTCGFVEGNHRQSGKQRDHREEAERRPAGVQRTFVVLAKCLHEFHLR